MTEIGWLGVYGCIVVLVAYRFVLARSATAMFGLSALNLFMVATATLSGFFFGTVFDQMPQSFTAEHMNVVSYSVLGLFAMVAGIYLAWLPCMGRKRRWSDENSIVPGGHINEDIGWLTFSVGATAELIYSFVYTVPTVSTAVYCISALARIGLCILLIVAIHSRRWARFSGAVLIFVLLSIVGSLQSGFTFIRVSALLPLFAIWFGYGGFTLRSMIRACLLVPVSAAVIFATTSAWLDTRRIIRGGSLVGLPLLDQATEFFTAYFQNLSLPSPDSIMRTIMFRVDMTEILAAQVRHQPSIEPYAHGATLLSSLYTLIPRALWQDKPVVAGGSAFVTQFTGLRWDAATSVGLPYPFELYTNGGPLLVIVGLGVVGYVCARLELQLIRPQKSLGGFWALALVTAVLTEGGQRTDVVLPALVASGLTAYGLGMIAERFFRDARPKDGIFKARTWRTYDYAPWHQRLSRPRAVKP